MSDARGQAALAPAHIVIRPEANRAALWRAALQHLRSVRAPAWSDSRDLAAVVAHASAIAPALVLLDIPPDADDDALRALTEAACAARGVHVVAAAPASADRCFARLLHPRITVLPASLDAETLAAVVISRAQQIAATTDPDSATRSADIDPLTGALDRVGFLARLQRVLAKRAERRDANAAVVFIDVDDFKEVNDSMGHDVGDRVLKVVAERLRHGLREIDGPTRDADAIGRLGGDEFAVLIEGVASSHEAHAVASRLADAFVDPVGIGHRTLPIGISMGVTLVAPEHHTPEDILKDADTAMYDAKRSGKSRFRVYDDRLRLAARRQARLESDLRNAAEHQQFAIVYQPIVQSEDGRIVALEALLRWKHPSKGVILPHRFLEAADDSGLLSDLTEWIVTHSVRQMKVWRERFGLPESVELCINLSRRQLIHPGFADTLFDAVDRYSFDPATLCLEFKEEALAHRAGASPDLLTRIHERGIKLAIDDFGAGAASLGALGTIPLDAIKIDQHCTDVMDGRGADRIALVDAILTMARRMSINAVAEGIAHSDQLATLLAMGCTRLQGNLIAAPLDARGIQAFIESQPPRSDAA